MAHDEPVETTDDDDPAGTLTVCPDEPPSSGEWVDVDDVMASLTEEEAEEGRRLGEEIDVEDDDDTGVADA